MRALAATAFFLSGASSLIFQTLWTRMLHLTFGATSIALSTVLTAFMSGLGLGAYLAGKRAARIRRPLAVYGIAELGVAACALAIPALVDLDGPLATVNALLRAQLGEASHALMLARFACVLPLLLVPTTLMGASLPLLAEHAARGAAQDGGGRVEAGLLYALNTLGAVAGTLLGSFVLMPAIGVRATNLAAVGINLALGIAMLIAARDSLPPRADLAAVTKVVAPPGRTLALFAFGVSGACAMAYEVVWSRALAMAIGSSLQSFALILVTFLLGIAGGSAVTAQLAGRRADGGLWLLSVLAAALCALALAPAMALSSGPVAGAVLLLALVALVAHARTVLSHARRLEEAGDELADEAERARARAGLRALALPVLLAALEVMRFASQRGRVDPVTRHGYLPYISATAVIACAVVLALVAALRRSPWLLATGAQLGIALATLGSHAVQDEIPYAFARLVIALPSLPEHVGLVRFFMLLTAGLCTLPAALGMGAMFPIALAQATTRDAAIGDDVGRVYGANTLGSIVGAWLPGFVLLPSWGMERTLLAGVALNATLGVALACSALTRAAGARAARWLGACSLLLTLATGACIALPDAPGRWNLAHMTLGAFRVSLADDVLDTKRWGAPTLLYYRDGVSTTVSVERWGKHHLSLKNNGKVEASNDHDMPTQVMVAAFPMLLHRRAGMPLDVALIGFGSGVTVGATLAFSPRRLDVIELEDAVVDAASAYFGGVNRLTRSLDRFPYVEAPGLVLHHDDGRNFLAATPTQYDVIISEPSNPWITGVSDLFTVEQFTIGKRRLAPGGLYCQWVQLYELSPENIKTVYRTFAAQFPYVVAFAAEAESSDTILIGSEAPIALDYRAIARQLDDPRIADELTRGLVRTPADVLARLLFAERDELLRFSQIERRDAVVRPKAMGDAPCVAPGCVREPVALNTDDNMRIELRAPADLIGFARYEGYLDLFYADAWPYGRLVPESFRDDAARVDLARALLAHGRPGQARTFAAHARSARGPDLDALDYLLDAREAPAVSIGSATRRVPHDEPRHAPLQAMRDQAERAFAAGDYPRAVTLFDALPLPLRTLSGPDLRFAFALSLYHSANGDRAVLKRAASELEAITKREPSYAVAQPALQYYLGRARLALRQNAQALDAMRTFTAATLARDASAASP
ncbi:MAG: hypothetical protein ABW252_19705 [Polyangiales bacterium]